MRLGFNIFSSVACLTFSFKIKFNILQINAEFRILIVVEINIFKIGINMLNLERNWKFAVRPYVKFSFNMFGND